MTSKISHILRETTIQQIYGSLIRYDENNYELEGKCVLGVLACESGNPEYKLDMKHNGTELTQTILDQYPNIPKDLLRNLPALGRIFEDVITYDFDFDDTQSLTYQIMTLNDSMKLSFDQIAEFLEVTYDL